MHPGVARDGGNFQRNLFFWGIDDYLPANYFCIVIAPSTIDGPYHLNTCAGLSPLALITPLVWPSHQPVDRIIF